MSGQNYNFTPGPWFGVWKKRGGHVIYLAKVVPVQWTKRSANAWMTQDASIAFQWLRAVREQEGENMGKVFRCVIIRTPLGALQLLEHTDVHERRRAR